MPLLRPLNPDTKQDIHDAVTHFMAGLPGSPGEEYLQSRGIGPNTARRLALGYVNPENPYPGWERFAGRISIPYLNANNSPVWVKLRATPSMGSVVKYAQQEGGQARLYNTVALSGTSDTLCLVEGEFDAITLTALGLTAVGVPGSNNWKDHFHRALQGFTRVVLFYDGDDAGRGLVKTIRAKMPDIIPIAAPGGHNDIGDAYQAGLGPQIKALATGTKVPDIEAATTVKGVEQDDNDQDTVGTVAEADSPPGPREEFGF